MTFLGIKLFLQKTWVFLKHYYYIPIIIVLIILGFIFLQKRSSSLTSILEKAFKSHQEEINVIKKNHQEEIEKREEAQKKYFKDVDNVNKKALEDTKKLKKKQDLKIKETISENKEDPKKLAEDISKLTGIKIEKIDQ